MKRRRTFILCISLLLAGSAGFAQAPKSDSVPVFKDRYGLRLGVDALKLARTFYEEDYRGLELTGDYRLSKKYYAAAEVGNESKTTVEDNINFTTKGSYLKIGFDYNAHTNWLDLENMIYIGLRYGFSTFQQELNSYRVYNPNPYWGEDDVSISGAEYKGLTAHWAEAVVGIKAQVFRDVFVGFSFRMNRLLSSKEPDGFENLHIPGYNRVYSAEFGVGMNYTVSYFIPLYKKDKSKAGKSDGKKPKRETDANP